MSFFFPLLQLCRPQTPAGKPGSEKENLVGWGCRTLQAEPGGGDPGTEAAQGGGGTLGPLLLSQDARPGKGESADSIFPQLQG